MEIAEKCAACGTAFGCGREGGGPCWCETLPPLTPQPGKTCLCRACLEQALKEQTAPDPRS
ncbi:MAG TPA: cysteine-rich CWC family protein [Burkholderiales bacterium]|nr:cysteine-rich CWC family protein [Burkholderiales bacterium]